MTIVLKKNINILFTLILGTSLLFCSCRKRPEKIGSNLQPDNSLITTYFTGDADIISYTDRIDSLSTSSALYTLLGNTNDLVFGKTTYSFYTQFSLSSTFLDWTGNPTCDSVVLQLHYENCYGDTNTMQKVTVFELAEPMFGLDSTAYFSNSTVAVDDNPVAECGFLPKPSTLSNIDSDTLNAAVLRIPLNNDFGQKFLDTVSRPLSDSDKFKEFFKGLYVTCETALPRDGKNEGAALYFSLTSSNSYIRIYYHNDNGEAKFYDFTVTSGDTHFNHFDHDFSSSVIAFNDTAKSRHLYVQGAAGVRSWINFPNLLEWARETKGQNGHLIVNQAKLILNGSAASVEGVENDTAVFKPITDLIVVAADGEGGYTLLPDQYTGAAYYGGTYDEETNQLYFRISEYITDIILKNDPGICHGLYFYTNYGSYNPRRWVFDGPGNADSTALKLEITYSIVKE